MISPGEGKAWEILRGLDPSIICRSASVSFDGKGGDLFLRGSHILPLGRVARRYGNDKEAFIKRGKELCAEAVNYGDVSIKLLPMPRIPVTVILWLKDEEFPPRADLLLDSTCELQLPLDIIWSIAM